MKLQFERHGRGMRLVALVSICSLLGCASNALSRAPRRPDAPWSIPGRTAPPAEEPADEENERQEVAKGGMPDEPTPPSNRVTVARGKMYGLAELIDLAQRHHPETREAWERACQAALRVGIAKSTYLPQLTASVVGGFETAPVPIPKNLAPNGYFIVDAREVIPRLAAKWLLFDFGQRAGLVQSAKAQSFVANVTFTGAHEKIIHDVSRAFYALGAARGRLRVAEQALESAEVTLATSSARRERGLATTVETAQAQRQLAQARFDLVRARGAEENAYAALVASVGIEPSTKLIVADSSELPLPGAPYGDIDRYVVDALARRPDILAALGKVRAAEGILRSAKAEFWPKLALSGDVYQNVGAISVEGSPYFYVNRPGANILLNLSLPLFDGGARDAQVRIARAEIAAANAGLDHARDTAAQQVSDAYIALRTSIAEYAAARVLVDAAQTAQDAALDAYRNGVGTYVDLVNSETALTSAKSEKVTAHANVFSAATSLAFVTGRIGSARH